MNTSSINTTMKVPSISGFNARDGGKLFDANFWRDVSMDPETKDWKVPHPLIGSFGSLGLGHFINADLNDLWSKSINDVKTFENLIKDNWKNEATGRRHHDVEALKAFFSFAIGDQPYFFLRNGQTILGLCKKLGGYSFQFDPENPMRYPHRISFEFLRRATEGEQTEFNMVILGVETKRVLKNGEPRIMTGKIRSFMPGSTLVLSAPAPLPRVEEMKVVDTGKRLAEISNEISAITETIKALAMEQEKLMQEQCELQTILEASASASASPILPAKAPRDLWKQKVSHDEDVLLTIHQNGVPDSVELAGPRFKIRMDNGVFKGFAILANGTTFRSASALCRGVFDRNGKTNEWRGPMHCLVQRNGTWIPLAKL
jgi:hypothetical protein